MIIRPTTVLSRDKIIALDNPVFCPLNLDLFRMVYIEVCLDLKFWKEIGVQRTKKWFNGQKLDYRDLPVAADGFTGALLVDPRVRACAATSALRRWHIRAHSRNIFINPLSIT